MASLPRRTLLAFALPVIFLLLLALGGSVWLWVWIPVQGKAWLESQLERQLPIDVSIRTLRYAPWQGLRLDGVEVRDRTDPSLVWLTSARMIARLDAVALAVRHQLRLRITGRLQIPCEADISAVVKVGLLDRRLEAAVATSEIRVQDVQPPVARLLPASLKDGRVRLDLRITTAPQTPPQIGGQARITQLVWEQKSLRFAGDGTLEGVVTPPADAFAAWAGHATLQLSHGTLDGFAKLQPLHDLEGTISLGPGAIQIASLTGRLMDQPWHLTGVVALDEGLTAELDVTSSLQLQETAPKFWPTIVKWNPSGAVELEAVCRGPLMRWPQVELLVRAQVRDGGLDVPSLPHRLEHLTATLQYDHLADAVTITALSARLEEAAVAAQGSIQPLTPPALHLEVKSDADLAALTPFLPAGHPIETMQGPLTVQLHLEGPPAALRWDALATLDGASVALRGWPKPLEAMRGRVRFNAEQLTTEKFSVTIDGHPVTISARLTDLRTTPQMAIQAAFSGGTFTAEAALHADSLRIRTAQLEIAHSYLEANGELGRTPETPSTLQIRGAIHLEDLSTLPWLAAGPWTQWQLEGGMEVQARLAGDWRQWSDLTIEASAQSDQISLRGMPIQALSVDVEQHEQRLAVQLAHATVAEGKLVGQVIVDHHAQPSRMLAEADLTQVNLTRLTEMLPAWRNRQIDGMASAHASLLGTWKDRAGWQGDGWVHAEGERLGQLPLFDRLFRGVFGALADRLGFAVLRQAKLVKVSGQWKLAKERVSTDDLQLQGLAGTEPVVVMFHGSVGLDQTLDFVVEPNLPEQLVLDAPNTSTISRTVLRVMGGLERLRQTVGQHHLGGTIEKPEYKFQVNLDQLLNQLVPMKIERLLESLR